MTTVRVDKYWLRIKAVFGLAISSLIAYTVAFAVRDVPEEGLTFQLYPLVTSLAAIFGVTLICGAPAICYLISKDQTELAKDYPDTTQRHWITIGIFSYFTIAIYPFWYFYRRHKMVKRHESPDERRDVNSSVPVNLILSIPRFTIRTGAGIIGFAIGVLTGLNDQTDGGKDTATVVKSGDQAKKHVTVGDGYLDNGSYESAITAYEVAIEEYEQVLLEARDEDTVTACESALNETREKLSKARTFNDHVTDIRTSLRDAESYFQTALVEHARKEYTPAKRDYRQACDKYEKALSALVEAEENVLDDGLSISIQVQCEPLPESLAHWPRIPEKSLDVLETEGIGSLTELADARDTTITDLKDRDDMDDELIDRLHAARRYQGQGERTYTNRTSIDRRREEAQSAQRSIP